MSERCPTTLNSVIVSQQLSPLTYSQALHQPGKVVSLCARPALLSIPKSINNVPKAVVPESGGGAVCAITVRRPTLQAIASSFSAHGVFSVTSACAQFSSATSSLARATLVSLLKFLEPVAISNARCAAEADLHKLLSDAFGTHQPDKACTWNTTDDRVTSAGMLLAKAGVRAPAPWIGSTPLIKNISVPWEI